MKVVKHVAMPADTSAWDNFGRIESLDIKFTYDSTTPPVTTGFITNDGNDQVSITISVYCYDKNGAPMDGLTKDDMVNALLPVYSDTQSAITQSGDASQGNPLRYICHGEFSSNNGYYTITYLISAPSSVAGSYSIRALFMVPTTQIQQGTSATVLSIEPTPNVWQYLGKITNFSLSFTDSPMNTSMQIRADNNYQIRVTATVTCVDTSGNPLYQMLPDNLFSVLDLIYYDSGSGLIRTEDLTPDSTGNPLTYARYPTKKSQVDLPRSPEVNVSAQMDGVYALTYYVSAPGSSDGMTSKIAARFGANSQTYATDGSSFDSSLTIITYSSPWWNLKSVNALSIAFTDYSTSTARIIHADGQYQIAVTFTMSCLDQNGQPLSGPSDDDLLGPASLIYFDSGGELVWTSSLSPSTTGNPLTYTHTPGNGYVPPIATSIVRNQPGTYAITFYISAPSSSDGATSSIAAKFIACGQTFTTEADSPFNKSLQLTVSASDWWNLKSITELDFDFAVDTAATSCRIYANGCNQVEVAITVKCIDQDGNPLIGMSDQSILDATSIIYDTGGNQLKYCVDPADGKSAETLAYSAAATAFAIARFDDDSSSGRVAVRRPKTDQGEYLVEYYVFCGDAGPITSTTIAAKFNAGTVTNTTQSSDSAFAKTLVVQTDAQPVYTSYNVNIDQDLNAQFHGTTSFPPDTYTTSYTVDLFFMCFYDPDTCIIHDATCKSTAPKLDTEQAPQTLFAIDDDQSNNLKNAFYLSDNYTKSQGAVTIQTYLYTLDDGVHSLPYWSVTDTIEFTYTPVKGPAFYRISAPTHPRYYNAGENVNSRALVKFHDQYGNDGAVYVCSSDGELDDLTIIDYESD